LASGSVPPQRARAARDPSSGADVRAAKDFTTVRFKGKKTVTVKLKAGKYKYYCAAHEATMFGHFTLH
jgi:plastocyanin